MHAMILRHVAKIDSSPLAYVDIEEPSSTPAPGHLRVRVNFCAICRTDLHIIEGEVPCQLPIVPGHQTVGHVDAIASDVTALSLGTRVGIAWLQNTCGQCRFCATHRENLCI